MKKIFVTATRYDKEILTCYEFQINAKNFKNAKLRCRYIMKQLFNDSSRFRYSANLFCVTGSANYCQADAGEFLTIESK